MMLNCQRRLSDKLSTLKVFFSHGTNLIYHHTNYCFLYLVFCSRSWCIAFHKREWSTNSCYKACFFVQISYEYQQFYQHTHVL